MKAVAAALVFLLCALNLFAQAQEFPSIPKNDKGHAEYSGIIQVDSTLKSDLFLSSLEWVNKTYKSGKSVIQTTDKEGGLIIGKGVSQMLIYNNGGFKKDGGYFSYTFSIFCKDNRLKYIIDNITYNKGEMVLSAGADLGEDFPHNWTGLIGNNKQTRREWKSFQKQADAEFSIIIANLKSHVLDSKKKANW